MDYRPDWGLILDFAGPLFAGYVRLLQVALLGFAFAMVLGIVLAVARLSPSPLFSVPVRVYVDVLRGIPLFLFLFLVYYGLPQVTPLVLGPFTAAVLALGLTGAAYAAEIYRGALMGVDSGQWEAADALGLSAADRMRRVVLPQATRIAVPSSVSPTCSTSPGTSRCGSSRPSRPTRSRASRSSPRR
jgi:His/Glu/Gln/Arg/opine family amino acid ABC transporter permease subunit